MWNKVTKGKGKHHPISKTYDKEAHTVSVGVCLCAHVCVFQASEQRVGPWLEGLQVVAINSTSGISSLADPAFGLDISVQTLPKSNVH